MDFYDSSTDNQLNIGEISELFRAPILPKIVVVGLGDDPTLKLFKEILVRALDNLFVIEFSEQFIPTPSKSFTRNEIHYRSHEVKESWMRKIRQERPAILIDFRLLSMYEDDQILADQLAEAKNALSEDSPVYLVWLAGSGISSQRLSALIKASKLDKTTISVIELWNDPTTITTGLKQRIQECFEHSRKFYSNMVKKYKNSLARSDQSRFLYPWMPSVYYYYKMAVLEELKGDFTAALKYFHTILAKFKELIEANEADRSQMINYLRKFADICFIRLSFLLFRLDQSSEAEFGLFRYLHYFSSGLSQNEQLLWRSSMSRGFAKQLMASSIWSDNINKLMRGPAHFLIYSLNLKLKYLKTIQNVESNYLLQEVIMRDMGEALESAVKNPSLTHFVDYLQLMILEQYFSQGLISESKDFLNYLKASAIIKKWKVIEGDVLDKAVIEAKRSQDYQTAVIDEWRRMGGIERDSESFEDWCLMHAQFYQEPIRINFPLHQTALQCNVKFLKKSCSVNEACGVELNILTLRNVEFYLESIGIFFDNDTIDPITFVCESEIFKPGSVCKFSGEFCPTRLVGGGKLKISFVTMQIRRPFLAFQFDDSCFLHQQNCERLKVECYEFSRLCQSTLKSQLSLRIEPLKPKLFVEIMLKDLPFVLVGSVLPFSVVVKNTAEHPVLSVFHHEGQDYTLNLGPSESQSLSMRYTVPFGPSRMALKITTKFNLELIDFKFADICSFDAVEEKFECANEISPVNPFKIALLKKKKAILISAYCDIEWRQLASEGPFIMRKGQVKSLNLGINERVIKGSFRLLEDSSDTVFQHEWIIFTGHPPENHYSSLKSTKMEMSSKLKAMKFMKRKDDAEERKQTEKEQQKSVDRTHWTLDDKIGSSSTVDAGSKIKFIVEYDNSAQIESGTVGRQSFRNFNKEIETSTPNTTSSSTSKTGPLNKIPKLENKKN